LFFLSLPVQQQNLRGYAAQAFLLAGCPSSNPTKSVKMKLKALTQTKEITQ